MDLQDRFLGCLLGLAAGDAVGTTVEFRPRGSFTPLHDMVGGGPFRLEPGQWTDDTSMALCLATSLVQCNGFDAADQMERYCRWRDEGYLSSNGRCFDIGNTVANALARYRRTGDPIAGSTDPHTAGNGSIMRLAPVPLFYFPDLDAVTRYAVESSRTTHAAAECLDACRLFAAMIHRALHGASQEEILLAGRATFAGAEKIVAIARGAYLEKRVNDIRGSGYVVQSLEAALWCFAHTDSFEQAILAAANLGDDADTTAAVCGQVAGAFYGASGIPAQWLARLALRSEIEQLAVQLMQIALRVEQSAGLLAPKFI
jgi:ADP-ribosyl-[dinitrogen reductase] hydrolase